MTEYIVKCNEVVGISGKALIVPDYIDTSKEIVRCRDCKFRCLDECTRIDEGFKDYWFAIEPDGFCAWAKRKESGDE